MLYKNPLVSWFVHKYFSALRVNTHGIRYDIFLKAGHQTQEVESMLVSRWSTVYDAEPTWSKHWFNVLCLLGCRYTWRYFLTLYERGPAHGHQKGRRGVASLKTFRSPANVATAQVLLFLFCFLHRNSSCTLLVAVSWVLFIVSCLHVIKRQLVMISLSEILKRHIQLSCLFTPSSRERPATPDGSSGPCGGVWFSFFLFPNLK